MEAVQIAFPHETSAGNADVAQNAGNDARAHAARDAADDVPAADDDAALLNVRSIR